LYPELSVKEREIERKRENGKSVKRSVRERKREYERAED